MVIPTRKLNKKPGPNFPIRREGQHPKGVYTTIRNRTVAPATVRNNARTVKAIVRNNTRNVKKVVNANETKRRRRDRRKARELKLIAEQINDPEILENIGLYVDEHGKIVSVEETVSLEQYDLLIKELENKSEYSNDDYEKEIIKKAIEFVGKSRDAHKHKSNMNSLESMMAKL